MDNEMEPEQFGKLSPLGYVVLQSEPITEADGNMWMAMVANFMPQEIFRNYRWIPLVPGDGN
jgi:hypothetical protein